MITSKQTKSSVLGPLLGPFGLDENTEESLEYCSTEDFLVYESDKKPWPSEVWTYVYSTIIQCNRYILKLFLVLPFCRTGWQSALCASGMDIPSGARTSRSQDSTAKHVERYWNVKTLSKKHQNISHFWSKPRNRAKSPRKSYTQCFGEDLTGIWQGCRWDLERQVLQLFFF